MSKDRLLSDEELSEKLTSMRPFCNAGYCDVCQSDVKAFIELFNTQKRLYAESVIGEDDPRPTNGSIGAASNPPTPESMFWSGRKDLRAEQRARNK